MLVVFTPLKVFEIIKETFQNGRQSHREYKSKGTIRTRIAHMH